MTSLPQIELKNGIMKTSWRGPLIQEASWRLLKGLRPRPIALERIELIRNLPSSMVTSAATLVKLLPELGLNDEGLAEFPSALHPFTGRGLRIWQYPVQFGPYLAALAGLRVRSYLELGIRHGGSFVATVELLERVGPLDFAVGVDIIPCDAMSEYQKINPRIRFSKVNSQTSEFIELLADLGNIDLVFIDSHHDAMQCRKEFSVLMSYANMVAFHDITNTGCPGIAEVWSEIKALPGWDCHEFTEQYPGLGPFMGIGLAIKSTRQIAVGDQQHV